MGAQTHRKAALELSSNAIRTGLAMSCGVDAQYETHTMLGTHVNAFVMSREDTHNTSANMMRRCLLFRQFASMLD